MTTRLTRDNITLAIALVGAGLGILNTLRALAKDRPRLHVHIETDHSTSLVLRVFPPGLRIRITNAGFAPVTVAEVGLRLGRPDRKLVAFRSPIDDSRLPCLLEPGSCASFSGDLFLGPESPIVEKATHAYASTSTGRVFLGNRRDIRKLQSQACSIS